MTYNPETARQDFPLFKDNIAFLDTAASAQKPYAVLDRMRDFAGTSYANVHRGVYSLADKATQGYEDARKAVSTFINAPTPDSIVFSPGATEGINLVAHSWGQSVRAGDEIIITQAEHHANIVPWHMLCERTGAVLKWANIHDDGTLDMDHLQGLITDKTRMIAIGHVSNVLGTINPVKEITKLAHDAGALCLVDGCQGIVHAGVDVQALGCDFYVFSAHKLYGPTGVGILYGRPELLADMPPFMGGGEMIESVAQDSIRYAKPPLRFEAGTPPIVETVGLHAAVDYLGQFDRNAIHTHEQKLAQMATDAIVDMGGRILGTGTGKAAIVTFAFDHLHAHDIAQILDQCGVCVRAGSHCAEPLHARLGVTSSARASFGLYNTEDDVGALISALTKAKSLLAA